MNYCFHVNKEFTISDLYCLQDKLLIILYIILQSPDKLSHFTTYSEQLLVLTNCQCSYKLSKVPKLESNSVSLELQKVHSPLAPKTVVLVGQSLHTSSLQPTLFV